VRLPFDPRELIRLAFDLRTWRAGLRALRVPSLVIAAFSCGLGVVLAYRDGRGDALASILVVGSGLVLQAGVNLVNDFFEFKQRRIGDKIAHLRIFGPERRHLEWLIFLAGLGCFAAVGPVGLFLAWRSGWPLAALGAVGFVGGYAYTGEPLNYKRRGLGVTLVFFLMGVLMVSGARYAVAGDLTRATLLVSLPVSCLVSMILLANELRDEEEDRGHGIRTLTVRWGLRAARILFFGLLAAAYAGSFLLASAGLLHRPWLVLAALPAAVPPSVLVFAPAARRRPIIPLVMLHHLLYGGLYLAEVLG